MRISNGRMWLGGKLLSPGPLLWGRQDTTKTPSTAPPPTTNSRTNLTTTTPIPQGIESSDTNRCVI